MADHKQEETFKVIDRRLFTEEGELRKEVVEQERREEEAAAKKAAGRPQPNSQTRFSGPPQAAPPSVADSSGLIMEGAGQKPTGPIEPSPNFQMLIDFLMRNAAAMLGGMNDPRTGQPIIDLEGAREVIDMLDELREKTRGNVAKSDGDLLAEVIGNLKLMFMEVSKAAAEAGAKKAGAKR